MGTGQVFTLLKAGQELQYPTTTATRQLNFINSLLIPTETPNGSGNPGKRQTYGSPESVITLYRTISIKLETRTPMPAGKRIKAPISLSKIKPVQAMVRSFGKLPTAHRWAAGHPRELKQPQYSCSTDKDAS